MNDQWKTLPDKPSELIGVALDDLVRCEKGGDFNFDSPAYDPEEPADFHDSMDDFAERLKRMGL